MIACHANKKILLWEALLQYIWSQDGCPPFPGTTMVLNAPFFIEQLLPEDTFCRMLVNFSPIWYLEKDLIEELIYVAF